MYIYLYVYVSMYMYMYMNVYVYMYSFGVYYMINVKRCIYFETCITYSIYVQSLSYLGYVNI